MLSFHPLIRCFLSFHSTPLILLHHFILNSLRLFQPMPGTTHSIGSLWFPGDGALWVSIGEGNIHDGTFWTTTYGYVGTDRALAMDPDFLGGKILRINPDTGAGLGDNPFCGGDLGSARCKVWAVGLRNPFKCAGGPGQVRCGDVGWYTIESYKVISRGQNTGWPWWVCFDSCGDLTFVLT
jgi:glucose/arabinose dehydrogenase